LCQTIFLAILWRPVEINIPKFGRCVWLEDGGSRIAYFWVLEIPKSFAIDPETIQSMMAQLRDNLSKMNPDKRPEALIRLCLLWGARYNASPDEMTAMMDQLRQEFGISESAVLEAIEASPLLSKIWPIDLSAQRSGPSH
jgi:hypothetical protein